MSNKRTGMVKFHLDPKNPPTLSPEQKAKLRAMKEEDIDYGDIPPQSNVGWTRPGALVPSENKQQVTLRLDADVLIFFRKTGKRYQSRINAALREYMNAHGKAKTASN